MRGRAVPLTLAFAVLAVAVRAETPIGRVPAAILLTGALATPTWTQIPAGPDFGINAYTTNIQQNPVVAADGAGNFVVVWEGFGSQDGSAGGIFARRYDAAGAALDGADVQVNVYTAFNQLFPSAVADASRIVVVWASTNQDGSDWGVYGRQIDAVTGAGGAEFPINTHTPGVQWRPAVDQDAVGNFVVVWDSIQDGDGYAVMGRRFSAAGTPEGPEFQVNSSTSGHQYHPKVAVHPDGGFVVVWDSAVGDGGGAGIFGQRFDAAGSAVGPEFQVNTYYTAAQRYPSVASEGEGGFVVVWQSASQDGDSYGVFGQRYDAAGAPRGPEFRVNVHTTSHQDRPRVASEPGGTFTVVWHGFLQDGESWGVFGRRYDRLGAQGGEFRLNDYTTGSQRSPDVAFAGAGRFVTVWGGFGAHDLAPGGIFGRRFLGDVIFRDDFEPGTFAAWSTAATGSGDLTVSGAAAMKGTARGLQGVVNDTAALYVQDDTPQDERRYRARFYLDPNGFDPGEGLNHRRSRVFIAFSEGPMRRVAAVVLRRLGGAYSVMARARLDDNAQADTSFVPITDDSHVIEIDLRRASGPDALDGSLELWVDGASSGQLTGLANSLGDVDLVRLGALSMKTGAAGTLFWDEFESRRGSAIGP